MRALRNDINQAIVDFITKKDKIKDLTTRGVDNKYSIFMNINVSNPSYDSQTKDTLTTPIDKFSKDDKIKFTVSDKFLNKIIKSEIVELVRDWYKKKSAAEDEKALRKINRETNKGLKRPDKYITCSSKKKAERQLWIFEGDSAKAGFRGGRNPEYQAGYTMRGVPLNCYGMTPIQKRIFPRLRRRMVHLFVRTAGVMPSEKMVFFISLIMIPTSASTMWYTQRWRMWTIMILFISQICVAG